MTDCPTATQAATRLLPIRRQRLAARVVPFAAEAWRLAETGELSDDELYPWDAQWCGLYDRIFPHTAEEMERRLKLAAGAGTAEA